MRRFAFVLSLIVLAPLAGTAWGGTDTTPFTAAAAVMLFLSLLLTCELAAVTLMLLLGHVELT